MRIKNTRKTKSNLKDALKELNLNLRIKKGNDPERAREKAFNAICAYYGFQPWKLNDQNGDWQKLCKNLLSDFVPAFQEVASGRDKDTTDEEKKKIALEYWFLLKSHSKPEYINNKLFTKGYKTTPKTVKPDMINIFDMLGEKYNVNVKHVINHVTKLIKKDPEYKEFCEIIGGPNWPREVLKFKDWQLFLAYHLDKKSIIKE